MARKKPIKPKRAPAKRRSNPKIERVARTSPDLVAEQVARLQAAFPEAVGEGRVDWEKLRATLGEIVDDQPERYSFTWTGKQEAIRVIQTPSRAALVPCPEESVNWDRTQHLFIEGENLEVLKLLYKAYFGRVKMIYIDPPYNTGNDFVYRDNYTDPLDTYLQLTGQRDTEGNLLTSNPQTSGRYHSAWLSMMYPRLFIARQLLREDGVIFVSIDDNEVHNLRMLMNEVFGDENFIALVVAQTNPRGRTLDRFLAKTYEYVAIYARDATQQAICQIPKDSDALKEYDKEDKKGRYRELELRNRNPVFNRRNRPNLFYPFYADPKSGEVALERKGRFSTEILPRNSAGEDGCWTWGKPRANRSTTLLVARQVGTGAWRVFRKDYIPPDGATTKQKALWLDKSINYENGKEELGRLFGRVPFDFPKSVGLMLKCLVPGANAEDDDLVLDFFAGSCTMAQAVFELNREDAANRRFIMVQLPEPTPEDSVATEMGYADVAEIGRERVRRVIKKLREPKNGQPSLEQRQTPEDLGFRVYKLTESSFRQWSPPEGDEPEDMARQAELFEDPLLDGWTPENVIAEVALKEAGFGLNYQASRVESITTNIVWRVCDPDREQRFLICLDEVIANETVRALDLTTEDLLICRDHALDDTLAANLATQCRLKVL